MLHDDLEMDVPMPYWLFSMQKIIGNFHRAAMFMDSQIWPWFAAPSP